MEHTFDFDVVKTLGSGSFGKVYLIQDRLSNTKYALKIIRLDGEGMQEAAMQEVEAMLKVKHVGIVQLIGSNKDVNSLHIVSEYCEGGDLNNFLKHQSHQLPEALIRIWMSQLSRGLQHLHELRIIHRDIKPQNIFLGERMAAKLGDLGIAKVFNTYMSSATDSLQGTLLYMAPEMFKIDSYSYKVDVWSLGCCLYEMMSLCRAFQGRFMPDIMRSVLFGKIPDFKTKVKIYSRELKSLVASMMERDPQQRVSVADIIDSPLVTEGHCDVPPNLFHLCPSWESTEDSKGKYSDHHSRNGVTGYGSKCSDVVISPVSISKISLQIEERERQEENDLLNNAVQQLQSLAILKNGKHMKNTSASSKRHLNNSVSLTREEESEEEDMPFFKVDDCLEHLRANLAPFETGSDETIVSDRKCLDLSDELDVTSNEKDTITNKTKTRKKKKSLLSSLTRSQDKDKTVIGEDTDKTVTGRTSDTNSSPQMNSGEVILYTRNQVVTYASKLDPPQKFSMAEPVYPHLSKGKPVNVSEHTSDEESSEPDTFLYGSDEYVNPKVLKRELEDALGRDLLQKSLSALKLISLEDSGIRRAVLQEMLGLPKYTEHSEKLFLLADPQNNS